MSSPTRLFLAAALGSLCAAVAGPSPAAAQAVRGELRWEERDVPLPGARLLLLSERGAHVDSTVTDDAGRFHLTAPEAGTYYLYFHSDGWASVTSNPVSLERGRVTTFDFTVRLVAGAAIRQMSDVIRANEQLQSSLPEICGGVLDAERTGVLVGVVRDRKTRRPIGGARVSVGTGAGGVARSTLSSETGVYVLCNVPVGAAVNVIADAPDGRSERTSAIIRAGTISWYDLNLRTTRR
ncbi:MAG TPA: carboxypeptidase-like regulatory domain-containing protein [Longimicrobiales bacterium]|nr:carboxypeptidase-like regulatory domain-containing protein [Longimicrobiales bacterium]